MPRMPNCTVLAWAAVKSGRKLMGLGEQVYWQGFVTRQNDTAAVLKLPHAAKGNQNHRRHDFPCCIPRRCFQFFAVGKVRPPVDRRVCPRPKGPGFYDQVLALCHGGGIQPAGRAGGLAHGRVGPRRIRSRRGDPAYIVARAPSRRGHLPAAPRATDDPVGDDLAPPPCRSCEFLAEVRRVGARGIRAGRGPSRGAASSVTRRVARSSPS
jgi:hypothetical protein